MFCACEMAITVYSAVIAGQTKQDNATVKKEFLDNLIPGIPAMPSGVWAVGRAQPDWLFTREELMLGVPGRAARGSERVQDPVHVEQKQGQAGGHGLSIMP